MTVTSALSPGHLETCEVCTELDALSFAELAGYDPASVPTLEFLTTHYARERVSAERIAVVRERVLALCGMFPAQNFSTLIGLAN